MEINKVKLYCLFYRLVLTKTRFWRQFSALQWSRNHGHSHKISTNLTFMYKSEYENFINQWNFSVHTNFRSLSHFYTNATKYCDDTVWDHRPSAKWKSDPSDQHRFIRKTRMHLSPYNGEAMFSMTEYPACQGYMVWIPRETEQFVHTVWK